MLDLSSQIVNAKVATVDYIKSKGEVTKLRQDLQNINASIETRAQTQVDAIHIEDYATKTALKHKADAKDLQGKATQTEVDTIEERVADLQATRALQTNVNDNSNEIRELMLEFAAINCNEGSNVVDCGQGGTCHNNGTHGNYCGCRTGYTKAQAYKDRPMAPCNDCAELYMKNAAGDNCVIDPCKTSGAVPHLSPVDCGPPSTGSCNSTNGGLCDCVYPHTGQHCELCKDGFVDPPACTVDRCWVNIGGTFGPKDCGHGHCDPHSGTCNCDSAWDSTSDCQTCLPSFYMTADGESCETNRCCVDSTCASDVCNGHSVGGADAARTGAGCDRATGECECVPNWAGSRCNVCHEGYQHPQSWFIFHWTSDPTQCVWDSCDAIDCYQGTCVDKPNATLPQGSCSCTDNFDPTKNCAQCLPGYKLNADGDECEVDICHENGIAKCTLPGSDRCETDGSCVCNAGYSGDLCDQCANSYVPGPDGTCIADTCKSHGQQPPAKVCGQTAKPHTGACTSPSAGNNFEGTCVCSPGYSGTHCSECASPEFVKYEGLCVTNPCWDTLHNHSVLYVSQRLHTCTNELVSRTHSMLICVLAQLSNYRPQLQLAHRPRWYRQLCVCIWAEPHERQVRF